MDTNDLVEQIHMRLIADPKKGDQYRSLLEACFNWEAVEGSLLIDDAFAAAMIRDECRNIPDHPLAHEKVATISKALGVVLRRYYQSRKQRRNRGWDLEL